MEHIQNTPPAAATDEPAVLSTPIAPCLPVARQPARLAQLAESLIESALDAGREMFPGRAVRHDGWTPDRIRAFLRALAATGCVTESARAAGVTRQAAYALRASTKGRAFALAWDGAVRISRGRLADDLLSRALRGNVETVYRDGEVVEQRHHHDNGLGLALLGRLDRLADRVDSANAARYVADEFDQFVEIAAAGGQGAADFVSSRCALGCRGHDQEQVLRRAENFVATGDGVAEGDEDGESPAVNLIRSLFAAATAEDDEDDYEEDDEDELDGEEAGETEPGSVDPDAAGRGESGDRAVCALEEDCVAVGAEPFLRVAPADPPARPDAGAWHDRADSDRDRVGAGAGDLEEAGQDGSGRSQR